MPTPIAPKIYHIVHVDRLPSIISDGHLWCDAEIVRRATTGTKIGMNSIKDRRLKELMLSSRPGLYAGDCVPFYFCPRSVMLYLIHKANHTELFYQGGQCPIIHLEADFHQAVAWAENNQRRWAFTLSNAGAYYVEDRCDLAQLSEIQWDAVETNRWSGKGISRSVKESKQAELLIEHSFPWNLVSLIGVRSRKVYELVPAASRASSHPPHIEIKPEWYC